ncbi:MAG: hypothetical protein AB1896_15170, partial [Thermodesulfobacteriota bacterium]
APAGPPAPPAGVDTGAIPTPGTGLETTPVFVTQKGYLASLQKEWLLQGLAYQKEGREEQLEEMFDSKKVVWLKAGLVVQVLEYPSGEDWVKCRIKDKETEFYTVRQALGQ